MIKHIIFDFFGVIVDSGHVDEPSIWSRLLDIDEKKLRPIINIYRDEINRGMMSIKDFWNAIEKDLTIKITEDPDLLFYKTLDNVSLYPEMINFVKKLKLLGYTCTILSDVFEPDYELVKQKGRYDVFDDLLLSFQLGLSKLYDKNHNTHKIFDYALDKYGLSPDEVIFIDDKLSNCKVANSIGIQTIHATSPDYVIQQLSKLLQLRT